jgi:cytochrome c oxidase cbb3-type subunit III
MMTIRLVRVALLVLGLSAALPVPARAQIPADVEHGKKLFEGMCARCHGIDGTGDEGPNLNRSSLTRAGGDQALRAVIRDGIPDRGMPRVRRLTDNELNQLVAYARSLGRTPSVAMSGDAGRGRDLYGRLGCASCHIITGAGGSFGPDLSAIGISRGVAYLRQSFLGPAEALPRGSSPVPGRGFTEYLPVRIVKKDGTEIRGVRVNEDPFTMQVRDLGNVFHSVRKSDVTAIEKEFGKSAMPSFRGRLSDMETDDLVAYLSSLRGGM